jgi:UV radiation resistance-associated gene protein
MSSLYFNKNISINQRSKRLRHVTSISAKNLQIKANKYNIWITFHSSRSSNAFYITDKSYNELNPKFNLININRFAFKEFIIRLWYSNLDDLTIDENRLNLLIEAEINLDYLNRLNDENLKYSIKNFNNLLIFEIFGFNFCEPIGLIKNEDDEYSLLKTRVKDSLQQQQQQNTKNSYTLNQMVRLHDYQRVIHETLFKINQLKNSSMNKFEATSLKRLRALQIKREELLQKIQIYKFQLNNSNRSLNELNEFNHNLKLITNRLRDQLNVKKQNFEIEKNKFDDINKTYLDLIKTSQLMEFKLKQRQKCLLTDLAHIFQIETKSDLLPIQPQFTNKNNKFKLIGIQFNNLNNNLANINDDTNNSILLGYIAHAVLLISTILSVPLRYPVIFRGSRSFIIEQIKEDSVCELPLFNTSGGQDVVVYKHGVELLNKDLAQLRALFDNYKNIDQKDMIANLKWLFEHLNT